MEDSTWKPDPKLVSECKSVQSEYAKDFDKYQRSPCGSDMKYGSGNTPSDAMVKSGAGMD